MGAHRASGSCSLARGHQPLCVRKSILRITVVGYIPDCYTVALCLGT